MNYIDIFIVIVFVMLTAADYRRGFLQITADLIGLVLAFVLALKFYQPLADYFILQKWFSVVSAKPAAFLAIWAGVQILFFTLSKVISYYLPTALKESSWNQWLGIFPALIRSAITVTFIFVLLITLPFSASFKKDLSNSIIGKKFSENALKVESWLGKLFGTDLRGLTIVNKNGTDETTKLQFTTTDMIIAEEAENKILEKVNQERVKNGMAPLKIDLLTRNVARAHSRDMLLKGYFSHNSPDGKSLLDRLNSANATFRVAAENLALAPTAELAHLGLMNSERHRKNILDPTFTKVGIGVMDAGQYGLMVTQDFID